MTAGLALSTQFADLAPEYPTFSVLITKSNRKQLVTNALRLLSGGTRTKDAIAMLDALEMLNRLKKATARCSIAENSSAAPLTSNTSRLCAFA